MIKDLKKIPFTLYSIIVHLFAFSILYSIIKPIIIWYLTKIPIRGTDIHLSVTYVNYILKWNEFLRPAGWKYLWFSGQPLYLDYPSLYFFAMVPLVKFFGLVGAVMHFAIFGLILFAFSSYLFYFEISKNRILALILTIATVLSSNVYLSLVWAGGIPFWTTQAFLPLVAFLVVKFLNSKSYRWLFLASIVSGLGILGHPQGFLIAIFPFAGVLILFYKVPRFATGIKNLIIFTSLSFLVALPGLPWGIMITMFLGLLNVFGRIGHLLGLGQKATSEVSATIVTQGNSFPLVYSGSLKYVWLAFFALALIWVVLMIWEKAKRRKIHNIFPFVFFLVFYLFLLFLFSKGIDFFFGGWYKALWVVPVVLCGTVSVFWVEINGSFETLTRKIERFKLLLLPIEIGFLILIYLLIPPKIIKGSIASIEDFSIPSRTQPDFLSKEISTDERLTLARKIIPEGSLDPNDKNKRLYAVDATFNLWWNSVFEMPLARGYIDPPITNDQRWGLFWLDSALGPSSKGSSSSLLVDWKVPKEVVLENYKFLLDWNAIYYLAGNWNHVVDNALATEAISDDLIEKLEQVKLPRPEWDPATEGTSVLAQYQVMNFYKVKSELVSPVLAQNNASPVLLVGDSSAYDTIYRFLGMSNLNSQKVVVATKSKFIDDYSLSELKKFDALILYRYDYHNGIRAWDLIKKYLQDGGNVYIDTGSEVKESASSNLPDYFPFGKSIRKDIGTSWSVSDADENFIKNVNFSNFSGLSYDGGPWNVSHPTNELSKSAKVILKNNGKVVAAQTQVGSGELIWTGFNLPYHTIYNNNLDEATFLKNLLGAIIDFSQKNIGDYKINWISPEKREINYSNARAVLFKEEAFPTWKAVSEKGDNLSIYKAGPTSPGYIYVPLDPNVKSGKVMLSYHGEVIWWVCWGISLASILLILEMIIFGKSLTTIPARRTFLKVRRLILGWWDKDE